MSSSWDNLEDARLAREASPSIVRRFAVAESLVLRRAAGCSTAVVDARATGRDSGSRLVECRVSPSTAEPFDRGEGGGREGFRMTGSGLSGCDAFTEVRDMRGTLPTVLLGGGVTERGLERDLAVLVRGAGFDASTRRFVIGTGPVMSTTRPSDLGITLDADGESRSCLIILASSS